MSKLFTLHKRNRSQKRAYYSIPITIIGFFCDFFYKIINYFKKLLMRNIIYICYTYFTVS